MLKIKPNYNVSGCVNVAILSSHLGVQCAFQAFLLSDFLYKPDVPVRVSWRHCASSKVN